MDEIRHIPVLLEETVDGLGLRSGCTVVDVTLGSGGHSLEILKRILPDGLLIAMDRDALALDRFRTRLQSIDWARQALLEGKIQLFHKNYAEMDQVLTEAGVEGVDGIVADLGFSSDQMDDPARGLSFLQEGPLDMRLDQSEQFTAERIVNSYSEESLTQVLRDYGDEKFAGRIARSIVSARDKQPLVTTLQLAEVVKQAIPAQKRFGKIHPATKTFQAIRIAVNHEPEHLRVFLPQAVSALKSGGRVAIISFHSGEDRIVKQVFRENAGGCICPPDFPVCRCEQKPRVRLVTKKPVAPSAEEIARNPRSRSARLRIAEKT